MFLWYIRMHLPRTILMNWIHLIFMLVHVAGFCLFTLREFIVISAKGIWRCWLNVYNWSQWQSIIYDHDWLHRPWITITINGGASERSSEMITYLHSIIRSDYMINILTILSGMVSLISQDVINALRQY